MIQMITDDDFLKSIVCNICFLNLLFSYQHFRTQIDPAEDPTSPADSNRTIIPPGSPEIHDFEERDLSGICASYFWRAVTSWSCCWAHITTWSMEIFLMRLLKMFGDLFKQRGGGNLA